MNTQTNLATGSNRLVVAAGIDAAERPALPKILSEVEAAELRVNEERIRSGLETFVEVGLALAAIRDRRLYRADFATFEDYCQEKWGMTARRARQIWSAAEVVRTLGVDGNNCSHFVLPATESQARPLAGLPPEEQREAWAEAVRTAPKGRLTAKHVANVVRRRRLSTIAQKIAVGGSTGPARERSGEGPAAPAPVYEAGSREERLRAEADAAIAKVRELMDKIGTPDSAAAVGVSQALQLLEEFKDHVEHVDQLQAARSCL